jgi:uncharacterized protein (UPF0332 family)
MKELVKYRINKSKETLKDAKLLFDKGSLFSSVNRLYYSAFAEADAASLTQAL